MVPLANGEPVSVIDAIEANAQRWQGVRIHQMHVMHDRPYLHGSVRDHLLHVSYFLSHITRPAFHERGCELVPNHFSEVPRLREETPKCSMALAAARSEEHTSELQSLMRLSYAVFRWQQKTKRT